MNSALKIKKFTSDIIDNINLEKYKEQYLDWLLHNKDDYLNNNELILSIIKNKNTPFNIILEFYRNYKYSYKELIDVLTMNLVMLEDLEVLRELLLDEDDLITSTIIENNNIDEGIVETILKYNKKKCIEKLIDFERLSLKKIIDINENSQYGLKDKAYKYLEKYVSNITSPKKLEKLMNFTSKDINFFISQNKYLTTELFNILVHSNDFQTRAILAQRTDTPIEVLYILMDDDSDNVKLSLAKNISSDFVILSSLALNDKSTILKEVILNNNTNKDILLSVINSSKITEEIRILANKQLDNLNNLNVESNSDYYEILEELKFGEFEKIELEQNPNLDKERKKVVVELSDNY